MPLAHVREEGDALASEARLLTAPGRRQRPSTSPRPDTSAPSARHPASAIHGFLFADLRGFTRYTDEHGDAAGAGLLERFRIVVRTAVKASEGAEIRTEGDSFYIVFGTASAAVRCGLDIVEAAAAASDIDRAIDVGVGVHAGEAIETEEGPVGSAVNIAERLCELAGPGEVVVSETVRNLAHGTEDVSFEPFGNRALRGLDEPIATFRVARQGPCRTPPLVGDGTGRPPSPEIEGDRGGGAARLRCRGRDPLAGHAPLRHAGTDGTTCCPIARDDPRRDLHLRIAGHGDPGLDGSRERTPGARPAGIPGVLPSLGCRGRRRWRHRELALRPARRARLRRGHGLVRRV